MEFSDSHSAITELKKDNYINLVFLDISLKKSDGFDVLTYIRNRTVASDIPVLVVSGDASKENIVKATDLGASGFIVKPFSAEAIEEKIEAILEAFFSPSLFLKTLRNADKKLLLKQNEQAIALYQDALAIEPGSMRAKHSIAIALGSSGKTKAAVELLEKCILENALYYRNYARLADLFIQQNRHRDAITALNKELELNPKQSERQLTLAKMLLAQGDTENAIARYHFSLKENPKNKKAYLGIVSVLLKKADLDKALYYLKQFRKNDPKNSLALRIALKACLKDGQIKKAEDFLRNELRRNPRSEDAHLLLIKLFIAEHRYKDAEKQISSLMRSHVAHQEAQKLLDLITEQKKKVPLSEKT